jgi:hypothetical protein
MGPHCVPERKPDALLADKGYDADAIRADLVEREIGGRCLFLSGKSAACVFYRGARTLGENAGIRTDRTK